MKAAALALLAAAMPPTPATASVVVAFDGTRCAVGANEYWLTGDGMTGPLAQLGLQGHTVQTITTITPAALAGARIFVSGALLVGTSLAQSEADALQAWVAGGGAFLYMGDNDSVSAANAQFAQIVNGPAYGGQFNGTGITLSIAEPTHPLVQGPGGVVNTISNLNFVGRWSSPGPGSTVVATNPDGSGALVAVLYGAGKAVLTNDVNYFAFPPAYSADHAALWDNVIAWLDRTGSPTTPFCVGDGTGTACPCGNSGSPGNGCANSIVPAGAHLAGSGLASLAADTFKLIGTGMPDAAALYYQGTSMLGGGNGIVFGDGLRCVGGTILRLGTKVNAGGTSQYPEAGDLPISVRGMVPPGGGPRLYQCWYRNADPGFCTPNTFNLSNGVEVTWTP